MSDELAQKEQLAPMEVAEQVMKLEQLKRDVDKRLKEYKSQLLDVMTEMDVVQLKTGSYTLSRKEYNRVSVEDDMEAKAALEAMEVPVETKEVLDWDLMKIPVKTLVDEGKQIPGIKEIRTPYVSVRLAKKGGDKT
jgi:hypothetical protein